MEEATKCLFRTSLRSIHSTRERWADINEARLVYSIVRAKNFKEAKF